jgi:hypothetical protein
VPTRTPAPPFAIGPITAEGLVCLFWKCGELGCSAPIHPLRNAQRVFHFAKLKKPRQERRSNDGYSDCLGLKREPRSDNVSMSRPEKRRAGRRHNLPCFFSEAGTFRAGSETLSNIGACLQVLTTVGIPAIFQFMMPNQTPQTCKVMWRDYTTLGVHFRSDASIVPDDVENTSSDLESVA